MSRAVLCGETFVVLLLKLTERVTLPSYKPFSPREINPNSDVKHVSVHAVYVLILHLKDYQLNMSNLVRKNVDLLYYN